MGTLKVNGNISATGTISATNGFSGNATTSTMPLGFQARQSSWAWGTITVANGYTQLTAWTTPTSGEIAFAEKDQQVSIQIDGYFYQNEGKYLVLDANNYTSYAPTKTGSGASGTWDINITGNSDTIDGYHEYSFLRDRGAAAADGEDTLWGQIGIKEYNQMYPSGAMQKYGWGHVISLPSTHGRLDIYATHFSSSSAQPYNGLQYRTGWNTDVKSWRMILDSDNYNNWVPSLTGSGASGTWGINITGNAGSASVASSASLLSIHNTVTNTSTRSTNASSWTGSVSGLNYVWGQAWKDTSIGSDSGDLVLGLRAGQYASGGTELCMMIDGDYYSMGNKVLHAGNYTSYTVTKTGSGASGTWGISVTGTAALSNRLAINGITTGDNHALALKNYFESNKSSIPRNELTTYYSSAYGNGSFYMGYFLSGYDSTPYGGFFVSHYDTPYYVGITYNNYNQQTILTSSNYGSWCAAASHSHSYVPLSGGTMTGHLYATSGLSWNHAYWSPNANIYCQPTSNNQEWSFDVGASGYTGCYWHVWSTKNACSMLTCYADDNSVHLPNGPFVVGSKCYGGSLPGASYQGQVFFLV